jgi:F-type H+-transporting ATPase subunit delta
LAVQIPSSEKKAAIDRMFQDFTVEMRNFLKLLIDKDRTYYLKEILKLFITRCNEELNIETAVVSSARKLSQEDMAKIREALKKKTGKEILLKNVVDESLIAGIKVTCGSMVTDVTTAYRINEMKELLLRGGMQ